MNRQLQVIKADGTREEYLHTKVWATLDRALQSVQRADTFASEQLADVVTYHLYRDPERREVTSSEVLSLIKVVLSETGYEDAAAALSEHHRQRELRRHRTEVIAWHVTEWTDPEGLRRATETCQRSAWNKSVIVHDLVRRYGLSPQTARAVASMTEERVLNMGLSAVPSGLIKQLVANDTVAILRAQEELQAVS